MKKIVIDTNLIVSAVVFGKNAQKALLFIIKNKQEFRWIASQEILDEYKTVLTRKKFRLSLKDKQEWFELLDDSIDLVGVDVKINFPRDQKDAKFLACAIQTKSDYLITGDKDFSEAQNLIQTKIISLNTFRKIYEI